MSLTNFLCLLAFKETWLSPEEETCLAVLSSGGYVLAHTQAISVVFNFQCCLKKNISFSSFSKNLYFFEESPLAAITLPCCLTPTLQSLHSKALVSRSVFFCSLPVIIIDDFNSHTDDLLATPFADLQFKLANTTTITPWTLSPNCASIPISGMNHIYSKNNILIMHLTCSRTSTTIPRLHFELQSTIHQSLLPSILLFP